MKQKRLKSIACTLLLAALCLPACNNDDEGLLPDGKYPIIFTTTVKDMTVTRSATADGSWTLGDRIAVKVDTDIKEYEVASIEAGGMATLTSTAPFYWLSSNEEKNVSAWYYGTGYSATTPTSWTVQSNQNNNNNYQQSDFLYAPAKSITFGGSVKSLTFYHQTAHIVINILKKEAATDVSAIQSVKIGNQNIAISGDYTPPLDKRNIGTWSISTAAESIIPNEITPLDNSYLKSYVALIIPQNMNNKQFIGVELSDGYTYYYTPTSNADFVGGNDYVYNITVKYGYLEVSTISSNGAWTNEGNETITSKTL